MAYGNIGNALDNLSRYDEAIEHHKKHLEISQQAGENWPIRAQHFENLILALFCPLGDISGEGKAYGNIASCFGQTGRFEESIEYSKKLLEIAQQTGEN